MIKKWFSIIMNHQINLQERMFCLATPIVIAARTLSLLSKILIGVHKLYLLGMLSYLAVISIVFIISMHYHKPYTGAIIISIITTFLALPFLFVVGGGLYGGVASWFIFFFVYFCLVIAGWESIVFLLLSAGVVIICSYVIYCNPNYLLEMNLTNSYIDSVISCIIVSMMIGIMIFFQNQIYQEENRLEEKQKEEIKALSQAQNHFFSSMSHEIRTPINTIIGLNEMILRGDNISEEIAEDAKNIQGASKMLLTLINDILDLSKIESGKMDIISAEYETGVFFSDIVNMIWVRAKEKGLEFHLSIDPSMPSMLFGDEVRIKQILVNLLNNAVKYTKEGSITLTVSCQPLSANRVMVSYEISDTGVGIKKESIPYLFKAFQRMDEKENRHIEGTGLGLSIVKQLVDLMGGEIKVNSVYTKGSTFLVTLEQGIINKQKIGEVDLESKIHERVKEQYKQRFVAPNARILIVDDNEMNLLVAKKLLSNTQIQIDTATSGMECLKLTQNIQYDGILMDHLMPEMDGIACLHALHSQSGGLCQETSVIALTANAGGDMQKLYKQAGFVGYLAKPVSGSLLEAAVLKLLPAEKVQFLDSSLRQDADEGILLQNRKQRVPLLITTDSACDLPKELTNHYHIPILPYYVHTSKGHFLDGEEVESDDLLLYLSADGNASSEPPSISDYEEFFAQRLAEAQDIIHISMTRYASKGYDNAAAAAECFENVTVFDSGHLSSGMGLFVLCAIQKVSKELPKEQLFLELTELRSRISSSFIMNNTKIFHNTGRISQIIQQVCDIMMLHPILVLKKSKLTIGSVNIGEREHVIRNYIRHTLKDKKTIDKRVLFIAYVGIEKEMLNIIKELVLKQCAFERIYIQKASPTISCNCGEGTFGLLFIRKKPENKRSYH